MKAVDKGELVTAMAMAYALYRLLPYWDNTAKLHGKMATLEPIAESWDGQGDLSGLRQEVKFLEEAVRRLHEREPHTRLLRHLTEWRERLEQVTAPRVSARGGERQ